LAGKSDLVSIAQISQRRLLVAFEESSVLLLELPVRNEKRASYRLCRDTLLASLRAPIAFSKVNTIAGTTMSEGLLMTQDILSGLRTLIEVRDVVSLAMTPAGEVVGSLNRQGELFFHRTDLECDANAKFYRDFQYLVRQGEKQAYLMGGTPLACNAPIRAFAFIAESEFFIAGLEDGRIVLFHQPSLHSALSLAVSERASVCTSTAAVRCLAAAGKKVAVGHEDGTLAVFGVCPKGSLTPFCEPFQHKRAVTQVSLSEDGSKVALGDESGSFCVIELNSLRTVHDHMSSAITALHLTPDGKQLIVGTKSMLDIWNFPASKEVDRDLINPHAAGGIFRAFNLLMEDLPGVSFEHKIVESLRTAANNPLLDGYLFLDFIQKGQGLSLERLPVRFSNSQHLAALVDAVAEFFQRFPDPGTQSDFIEFLVWAARSSWKDRAEAESLGPELPGFSLEPILRPAFRISPAAGEEVLKHILLEFPLLFPENFKECASALNELLNDSTLPKAVVEVACAKRSLLTMAEDPGAFLYDIKSLAAGADQLKNRALQQLSIDIINEARSKGIEGGVFGRLKMVSVDARIDDAEAELQRMSLSDDDRADFRSLANDSMDLHAIISFVREGDGGAPSAFEHIAGIPFQKVSELLRRALLRRPARGIDPSGIDTLKSFAEGMRLLRAAGVSMPSLVFTRLIGALWFSEALAPPAEEVAILLAFRSQFGERGRFEVYETMRHIRLRELGLTDVVIFDCKSFEDIAARRNRIFDALVNDEAVLPVADDLDAALLIQIAHVDDDEQYSSLETGWKALAPFLSHDGSPATSPIPSEIKIAFPLVEECLVRRSEAPPLGAGLGLAPQWESHLEECLSIEPFSLLLQPVAEMVHLDEWISDGTQRFSGDAMERMLHTCLSNDAIRSSIIQGNTDVRRAIRQLSFRWIRYGERDSTSHTDTVGKFLLWYRVARQLGASLAEADENPGKVLSDSERTILAAAFYLPALERAFHAYEETQLRPPPAGEQKALKIRFVPSWGALRALSPFVGATCWLQDPKRKPRTATEGYNPFQDNHIAPFVAFELNPGTPQSRFIGGCAVLPSALANQPNSKLNSLIIRGLNVRKEALGEIYVSELIESFTAYLERVAESLGYSYLLFPHDNSPHGTLTNTTEVFAYMMGRYENSPYLRVNKETSTLVYNIVKKTAIVSDLTKRAQEIGLSAFCADRSIVADKEILQSLNIEGKTLLSFGCGLGCYEELLCGTFNPQSLLATDINKQILKDAGSRLVPAALRFQVHDALHPVGGSFDIVMERFLLHQMPDNLVRSVIEIMAGATASGGSVLLIEPEKPFLSGIRDDQVVDAGQGGAVTSMSETAWMLHDKLCSAGFEEVKVRDVSVEIDRDDLAGDVVLGNRRFGRIGDVLRRSFKSKLNAGLPIAENDCEKLLAAVTRKGSRNLGVLCFRYVVATARKPLQIS
jgi:hypothetical protein